MGAKRKQHAEEMEYKYYITDALMCIAENTQRFNGGRNMKRRYADAINPKKKETPQVSGKEIATDLISKIASVG